MIAKQTPIRTYFVANKTYIHVAKGCEWGALIHMPIKDRLACNSPVLGVTEQYARN